jgi:SAM-dependent methyltransferase
MPARVPERLSWATAMLAVEPADQVLEVGCGPGVAVSLICERLETGRVTAIDRSPVMVRRALERNQAHVAAGRARIERLALEEADFGATRFHRILAVNVNAFWTHPAAPLDCVRRALAPGGTLLLVYQPPSAAATRRLAEALGAHLPERGLAVRRMVVRDRGPVPLLGVMAG